MNKKFLSFCLLMLIASAGFAQRFTDRLDRGLVAMKASSGIYLSWRVLAEEYYDVTYNVYRDGTLVNAKRYCLPHLLNRLVYSTGLRKPKGLRAFTYPTRLLERGIETPEPIAYIEQRRCGLLGLSYFVSVQSPSISSPAASASAMAMISAAVFPLLSAPEDEPSPLEIRT